MGVRDGEKVVEEVQLDGRVWKKKRLKRMYRKEKRRKRWKKGGM